MNPRDVHLVGLLLGILDKGFVGPHCGVQSLARR
jgi:hypothetical protein